MPPSEITTRVARLYMRPDGIVVAANFPNVGEQTLADAKENIRAVAALAGNTRVPFYIQGIGPIAADARKYYLSSAQHFLAAAIVADNVLSRVMANLFIPVQRLPIPMKLFATEEEALAWLRLAKASAKA
jgi:hypothetical protein